MKFIRIDRSGVTELEADEAQVLVADINWDLLRLDASNDIWADDEAFQKPDLILATIGHHRRVPLPAYICGHSGERNADTTLSADDVRGIVALEPGFNLPSATAWPA